MDWGGVVLMTDAARVVRGLRIMAKAFTAEADDAPIIMATDLETWARACTTTADELEAGPVVPDPLDVIRAGAFLIDAWHTLDILPGVRQA